MKGKKNSYHTLKLGGAKKTKRNTVLLVVTRYLLILSGRPPTFPHLWATFMLPSFAHYGMEHVVQRQALTVGFLTQHSNTVVVHAATKNYNTWHRWHTNTHTHLSAGSTAAVDVKKTGI